MTAEEAARSRVIDSGGTREKTRTVSVSPSHPMHASETICQRREPCIKSTTGTKATSTAPLSSMPASRDGTSCTSARLESASRPSISGFAFKNETTPNRHLSA